MPVPLSTLAPRWRALAPARRLAGLGLLVAVALPACAGLSDLLTPGTRNADLPPARLSLQTAVHLANTVAGDAASLEVRSQYRRRDGTDAALGTQTLPLSADARQAVPVTLDLAACLADPARDAPDGDCPVVLQLALLVDGVVVDRQVLGPLRLRPGQPTVVATPVTLFDLAALGVLDADGATLGPDADVRLVPGATRALRAQLRDRSGRPVTERVVSWRSDAPTVATVSADGVVTAVGVGTARVSATQEALSASVRVSVARPPVALTVRARAGSGRGTVRSTPAGIDCRIDGAATSGPCSATFPADAPVTLHTEPAPRQRPAAWGDACADAGSAPTCTLVLSSAREASAGFDALRTVSLVAAPDRDGRGRVTGGGLDCQLAGGVATGTCEREVVDGTVLELEATAADSGRVQRFAGWGAACADAAAARCTLTVRGGDLTVAAGFFDARTLSVVLQGAGAGVLTGLPGVACVRADGGTDAPCEVTLEHGRVLTLAVTPDARSTFAGWSGACTGSQPTCTVSLTAARSVVATFARRRTSLTLEVTGPGSGTVRLDGAAFCVAAPTGVTVTCTRELDAGTRVVLRGDAANAFSRFAGFDGACQGTDDCSLVVDAPSTVRAAFGYVPLELSVVPGGASTGSGRVVVPGPGGLDCTITLGVPAGAGCTMTVPPFTAVTLAAQPAAASALVAWGDACAAATTLRCTITPASLATRVSARFTAAIDVELVLNGSTGAGSIRFEIPEVPAQPVCEAVLGATVSCRFSLPLGSTGVFRATAAPGYVFTGFTGPCLEGTAAVPTCTYRGFGFVREIQAAFVRP